MDGGKSNGELRMHSGGPMGGLFHFPLPDDASLGDHIGASGSHPPEETRTA
jgi:hypothetical protein